MGKKDTRGQEKGKFMLVHREGYEKEGNALKSGRNRGRTHIVRSKKGRKMYTRRGRNGGNDMLVHKEE